MTDESSILLLKCKLHSLIKGLNNAIDNKHSKSDIRKWRESCVETQIKISELIQD